MKRKTGNLSTLLMAVAAMAVLALLIAGVFAQAATNLPRVRRTL